MYKILLTFLILLVLLVVFAGHVNYFWHQADIRVVDKNNTMQDLGPGRFWFGFHNNDVYVYTDKKEYKPFPGYKTLILSQSTDGALATGN